jgi:hypothetical protein
MHVICTSLMRASNILRVKMHSHLRQRSHSTTELLIKTCTKFNFERYRHKYFKQLLASFFSQWLDSPSWPWPPHCRGFAITLRHITLGRTALDEWSARRRTSTWQHTTLTRDRHPCPRRDSNPQSQQAKGRRPTPENTRSLGSAITILASYIFKRLYFYILYTKLVCWYRQYCIFIHFYL